MAANKSKRKITHPMPLDGVSINVKAELALGEDTTILNLPEGSSENCTVLAIRFLLVRSLYLPSTSVNATL